LPVQDDINHDCTIIMFWCK